LKIHGVTKAIFTIVNLCLIVCKLFDSPFHVPCEANPCVTLLTISSLKMKRRRYRALPRVISRSNRKRVCLSATMHSISLCVHASRHLTFGRNLVENRFEKSRTSWVYAVTFTNITSNMEGNALVKHPRYSLILEGLPGSLRERSEWGHRGVRRRRVESIKTSRKQVRSDPPGKFKRTFHRVVITRIRVARASVVTLPKSFPDPVRICSHEGRKLGHRF